MGINPEPLTAETVSTTHKRSPSRGILFTVPVVLLAAFLAILGFGLARSARGQISSGTAPDFIALIFSASPANTQAGASPIANPSGSPFRPTIPSTAFGNPGDAAPAQSSPVTAPVYIGAGFLGAVLIAGGLWWRRSKLEKHKAAAETISESDPKEIGDQDTEPDQNLQAGCGCGKEYMGIQEELIQWAKANATGSKTKPGE